MRGTPLSETRPEIAERWHPVLNGELTPSQVSAGSHTKAWWICPIGHEYDMPVSKATRPNAGCPVCSGKRIFVGQNDLATTHPEFLQQWSPNNPEISPTEVQAGSNRKVQWRCPEGHDYAASPANKILLGTNCPYCSGNKVLQGYNDMATTNPNLASELDNSKNGSVTPYNIVAGTSKRLWWMCSKDSRHSWQASGDSRVRGTGCPLCTNQTIQSGINDLATTNPELIHEWDAEKNIGVSIDAVGSGSHQSVWWQCANGHSWKAQIDSRAIRKHGCAACAGQVAVTGENDLATTNPDLLSEWDFEKNSLDPTRTIAGTNKSIHWICKECGHKWEARGNKRVVGQGCPMCSIGGFQPSKPSIFYFIEHPEFLSRKIGITNVDAKPDRLVGFKKLGWTVLATWSNDDGLVIQRLETILMRWLRKDLKLPPYLSRHETGHHAGWTETFSTEGPANVEIIRRIEAELAELLRK